MRKTGLILCSAIGATIVGLYDLCVNGNQSLIIKFGEIIRRYFISYWDSSAWAGLIIIILIASFISHVKDPITKWGATEIGLGIIALITTFASPLKQETISTQATLAYPLDSAYAENEQASTTSGKFAFEITDAPSINDIYIQLRDAESDKILKSIKADPREKVEFRDVSAESEYVIYLEGKGQRWTKFKIKPSTGEKIVKIKISPSVVPMVIQRFMGASKPEHITEIDNK